MFYTKGGMDHTGLSSRKLADSLFTQTTACTSYLVQAVLFCDALYFNKIRKNYVGLEEKNG